MKLLTRYCDLAITAVILLTLVITVVAVPAIG